MKPKILISICILTLNTPGILAFAETRFPVRHNHGLKSCAGELVISDTQVEYLSSYKKHARTWAYADIQQLGLLGEKEITVVSYEDQKWVLGKDRRFHFELLEGKVSDSLRRMLETTVSRPLVSEVLPKETLARFELPVKHQHAWGGCQGTLRIGEATVVYETPDQGHSRIWLYGDLSSMGSTGPFQLRLSSMERTGSEIGDQKNFIFDLKRRLSSEMYDFLWWKVNGPSISDRSHLTGVSDTTLR